MSRVHLSKPHCHGGPHKKPIPAESAKRAAVAVNHPTSHRGSHDGKSNPPVAKVNPPKKAITPVPKTTPQNKTVQPKTNPPAKKDPPATVKKTTPKPPPAKKPVTATTTPKTDHKIKELSTDTIASNTPPPTAPGPVPRVLATRQNELVKTITSSANDIYIKIYDNGTVDNDTVSVYIDKKLVISKQRLTEQPLTVKVNLDEKINFHELVMVAENLGEIPPNTSLMVVNAGDQQHEVRITSTEQKNAVVHFRFSK